MYPKNLKVTILQNKVLNSQSPSLPLWHTQKFYGKDLPVSGFTKVTEQEELKHSGVRESIEGHFRVQTPVYLTPCSTLFLIPPGYTFGKG